jgi:hypothetical protein
MPLQNRRGRKTAFSETGPNGDVGVSEASDPIRAWGNGANLSAGEMRRNSSAAQIYLRPRAESGRSARQVGGRLRGLRRLMAGRSRRAPGGAHRDASAGAAWRNRSARRPARGALGAITPGRSARQDSNEFFVNQRRLVRGDVVLQSGIVDNTRPALYCQSCLLPATNKPIWPRLLAHDPRSR